MARILLFNPTDSQGNAYTREGRCTQKADTWGTVWPPLSLATAAAMLQQDGHQISVIDFSAAVPQRKSLSETIQSIKPNFAIWPTGTETLSFDVRLAELIKENSSSTITAVFGTHVSALPGQALANPCIDAVIRREPEGIIRELCRSAPAKWAGIDGLSYRDPSDGQILSNPDAAFLEPETIPAPAWHFLNLNGYRLPLKNRKFLIIAPIRGCPYACNFCTAEIYYGRKPRYRPVENVIDEIAGGISRHGIRDYFIWADTFTVHREYVRNFCRMILDRKLSIAWTCNSRVDTLDEETLALMKKAGLWMISFGLESGSNGILEASGKRMTVEQSRQAVQMAHEMGIKTAGHFMFGLPGETAATMKETLDLALSLPLDIGQFYAATPFPGTKLFAQAGKQGWLKPDVVMSQSRAVMDLPELKSRDIDRCIRYAYRKFYLRPRIICGIGSMIDPRAQMKYFFSKRS
ncbi:MAG: Oxygen-independent coproporphyrinogen-III oxidase 1 [Deltaproteobacteria bacterium ADurb.Bin151]|jgi:radical SAM superfamily enzyme YgiQ (UPF0313 family)|nr:MAG: Oxygen-independent coproporphyrinogen-III oxidase 1 [Deltaproteobacteria bacterium ADurb.Bin151]